jgi:hypothetical protein
VLQFAEGLSDRQAADQVRARMDWKFLLGLELDDPGFDFTILGEFRSRLIRHGLEEKVLEAVLDRLSAAGLLRAGGRQRTDSTHVLAAVRTLNRMEFVGETLRAALEALAAAAPGWLSGLIGPEWADRYGTRIDSCRFPKGDDARARWLGGRPGRVHAAGRRDRARRPGMAAAGPCGLGPAPGLGPAVPPGRGGGALAGGQGPPARRTAAGQSLRPRCPLRHQTRSGPAGCKVHLTEACEPDLPHLVTNVETTAATVDDAEMTAVIHQRLAGRRLSPAEHAAGAGYVSAGHILAARGDHGITLLGPVGADTTQSRRGDGKEPLLPQDAFTVDWDARKVTCPQGAASISWSDQRKPSGTPVARVHFALADCDACPLRARCTKAANGRYGRSLTLLTREQHEVLARQRAEQQTPEWKARYNIRAGVEGTISQAVRATRMRSTPCHGQPKTHLASVLNATAINLIRTDAWLNGTPLGTTRVSHLARLDLAA